MLDADGASVVLAPEEPPPDQDVLKTPFVGHDGETIGHLCVHPPAGRQFDRIDRAIARQLASIAAVAFENSRLYEELREGSRRKDAFLATLAHELRNPLAPIGNALQIMGRPDADHQARERYRKIAARQVEQLRRLVDDLIDLSRVNRGTLHLRPRRVRLKSLVQDAVDASRHAIDAEQHSLEVSVPDEPIEIHVDPERITQVMLNLLINAARYTDAGGRIDLAARAEEDDIQLSVRDNGIGVEPDKLEQIFDPFTQAGRRDRVASEGLGIGLSLARQVVRMHGGSIAVKSDGIGHGSEFIVRLPRSWLAPPGATEETADPAPEDDVPSRPLRVVAVDDNRDAADTLGDLLRMDGHEVRTAYDGETLMTLTEDFIPDLAFVDLGLPGMSGLDVARAIRSDSRLSHVVLVALTGWGQEDDRRRSADAGFDRHLVKPLAPEALREVLATVAERSSAASGDAREHSA